MEKVNADQKITSVVDDVRNAADLLLEEPRPDDETLNDIKDLHDMIRNTILQRVRGDERNEILDIDAALIEKSKSLERQ